MNNGAPITAAIFAAAVYLAVFTEPGQPEAQPVAVAPTDATPVQAATITPAEVTPTLAVRWFRSDAEAWAESQRTGRPHVRLVTQVENCTYCRQLEDGPLSDAETVQWLNNNVVMTQRIPYRGERGGIPRLEVRTGLNRWQVLRIPTYEAGPFRRWLRGLFE